MQFLVDTHTHTVASGHTFSTLLENIQFAAQKGLQAIVTTDHAPSIPGAQPAFTLRIQRAFPKEYMGVRLFRGVETNIMNYEGEIDVEHDLLDLLDFVVASMHSIIIKPGSSTQNTHAMLSAMNNKYVDAVGHPFSPEYDIDIECIVLEAKKLGKLIELNNNAVEFRPGAKEGCEKFIQLCKKHEVQVCVCSDAHVCFRMGNFAICEQMLAAHAFPKQLIASASLASFERYLATRQHTQSIPQR